MPIEGYAQNGKPSSRTEEIWQQIVGLTIDEKAELAERLLSIPELSVVLSDSQLHGEVVAQIKQMPPEQLGEVVCAIGNLILSEDE